MTPGGVSSKSICSGCVYCIDCSDRLLDGIFDPMTPCAQFLILEPADKILEDILRNAPDKMKQRQKIGFLD
jgi:hypothetical protein